MSDVKIVIHNITSVETDIIPHTTAVW